MSGAGNVFLVLDAIAAPLPPDAPAWVPGLCRNASGPLHAAALRAGLPNPSGRALDGVLVLAPAREPGAVSMQVFNADGSRAEACGNGLRCLARFARELGHASADVVRVETDAGPRRVELLRTADEPLRARASMGVVRVDARGFELALAGHTLTAWGVDVGNPHCVIFVEELERAPLAVLGAALQVHERFPGGVNVELVRVHGARLELRVWERGVGETAACGTGACAAAFAAHATGRVRLPAAVELAGGPLVVGRDADGEAWIEGENLCHALGEWNPEPEQATGERA